MALIAMAVWDTVENKRTQYTAATLECLADTVDLFRHRVIISDNGSCASTQRLYNDYPQFTVIRNGENLGTAEGVNRAWRFRRPDEHAVKMDNDVVIHSERWCDELEHAIERAPEIGILGLKRKDLAENPWRTDHFRSELRMLPHSPGQPWMIVEEVCHVMGTCQMFNYRLLEKIGYLYQPRLYGFDDSLAAVRCTVAGFKNCFLPHIEIDHIDPGGTPYQEWKHKVSGDDMATYNMIKLAYMNGTKSVYHNPFQHETMEK